jgi:hypothetical protein
VRLSEVLLVAHHTPGHTRGATTWETTLVDNGPSLPGASAERARVLRGDIHRDSGERSRSNRPISRKH